MTEKGKALARRHPYELPEKEWEEYLSSLAPESQQKVRTRREVWRQAGQQHPYHLPEQEWQAYFSNLIPEEVKQQAEIGRNYWTLEKAWQSQLLRSQNPSQKYSPPLYIQERFRLISRIKWNDIPPFKESKSFEKWITDHSQKAFGHLLPLPPEKSRFTTEEIKRINLAVKEASIIHIASVLLNPFLLHGEAMIGNEFYLNQERPLHIPEFLAFYPPFNYYRELLSQVLPETYQKKDALTTEERVRLGELVSMELEEEKFNWKRLDSNPLLIPDEIQLLERFIYRRNILEKIPSESLSVEQKKILTRLRSKQLEQRLQIAQHPETIPVRITEIDQLIEEKATLQQKASAFDQELERKKQEIMVQMNADEEIQRQSQLAEIMEQLPQLEPMYRQALAKLHAADYFYPGVRIPGFTEICHTLFNIEKSRGQPFDYRPPEGLDKVMPELIQILKTNPQLILSIMMLGLMGHYPAVGHYDKNSFHIVTTASNSKSIHCVNCVYDKEAEDWVKKKRPQTIFNGNVVDRAAFMSSEGATVNLMPLGVYLRKQHYQNEQDKTTYINRLSRSYKAFDVTLLPDYFDEQTGHWAEGSFDSHGSSWIETPEDIRGDKSYHEAGSALEADCEGPAVRMLEVRADRHGPYLGWAAMLRVERD